MPFGRNKKEKKTSSEQFHQVYVFPAPLNIPYADELKSQGGGQLSGSFLYAATKQAYEKLIASQNESVKKAFNVDISSKS